MEYTINIMGQQYVRNSPFRPKMVSNSNGVYCIKFNLDSSWDGLSKFACFKNSSDGSEYHILLNETLTCMIPWECLVVSGTLYIGVLGIKGSDVVKPTIWIPFSDVVLGVNPEGDISKDFTPTILEQVMTLVNEMQDIGEQLKEDAENGVFDGYSPIVTVDETENGVVITVKDSKGETSEKVMNGSNGGYYAPAVSEDGELSWTPSQDTMPAVPSTNIKGPPGTPGKDGEDGKDGYTPVKGVDYFDGRDGKDGAPGPSGPAGKTPEKGVDYFTDEDRSAMVNDVLAALPTWTGGAY